MKVRALSRISGPMGVKAPGEEFIVDAATGADLIERHAAEEVAPAAEVASANADPATKTAKPRKPKA